MANRFVDSDTHIKSGTNERAKKKSAFCALQLQRRNVAVKYVIIAQKIPENKKNGHRHVLHTHDDHLKDLRYRQKSRKNGKHSGLVMAFDHS